MSRRSIFHPRSMKVVLAAILTVAFILTIVSGAAQKQNVDGSLRIGNVGLFDNLSAFLNNEQSINTGENLKEIAGSAFPFPATSSTFFPITTSFEIEEFKNLSIFSESADTGISGMIVKNSLAKNCICYSNHQLFRNIGVSFLSTVVLLI